MAITVGLMHGYFFFSRYAGHRLRYAVAEVDHINIAIDYKLSFCIFILHKIVVSPALLLFVVIAIILVVHVGQIKFFN